MERKLRISLIINTTITALFVDYNRKLEMSRKKLTIHIKNPLSLILSGFGGEGGI